MDGQKTDNLAEARTDKPLNNQAQSGTVQTDLQQQQPNIHQLASFPNAQQQIHTYPQTITTMKNQEPMNQQRMNYQEPLNQQQMSHHEQQPAQIHCQMCNQMVTPEFTQIAKTTLESSQNRTAACVSLLCFPLLCCFPIRSELVMVRNCPHCKVPI